MKYFETVHERNAAKITTLIAVLIVLLLFIAGTTYLDPPLEYGVAVNFGTTDYGSGNIQPTKPIKSQPKKVVEQPKVEASKKELSSPSKTKAEDVLTAEDQEAIAIKKQKEAEAKALAEAERKEQLRKEAEQRRIREEAEKKKKLDALIGGVSNSEGTETGGEGPDSQAGDKGQLDGSPYAPYEGLPGSGAGGVGYGLNGRGKPNYTLFEGCENAYGLVVVDIVVNQKGNVIEANPGVKGSTNVTSCLKEVAKKIAMSYKWPQDLKAPTRQYGKVVVNFTSTK